MTERRLSPAERQRRLERCQADYDAVKARVADIVDIGFVCEGSLVERYSTCSTPNCRCADPARRHGPYWQLSWKENGRTVSRPLPAEEATLYREWIANRRHLEALLAEMRRLSLQATEHLATQAGFTLLAA